MKTGRLLKFHRPGGEVHAYLYRDGTSFRATLYLSATGARPPEEPVHALAAGSEAEAEQQVRRWVDEHYPKGG